MRIRLTFKDGPQTIAVVNGKAVQTIGELSDEDLKRVIEIEQLIERLTGFRVHITSEE